MAKRKRAQQPPLPVFDKFVDETARIPEGGPVCWLLLEPEEVEKMSTGRLPRRVVEICWQFLSWKRELAQDWEHYPDTPKPTEIEPW